MNQNTGRWTRALFPMGLFVVGLVLFGGPFSRLDPLSAQEVIRPDLSGITSGEGWSLQNRAATVETEGDRIVAEKPEIRVFLGEETEPCLVVTELTDREGGRVGLWMGNGSDGSFAEFVIKPAGTGG